MTTTKLIALFAWAALLCATLSAAQKQPYDHQTATYTARFAPETSGAQATLMPYFSPDHSIDTLVALLESATTSIDVYTPGFSSWIGCTQFDTACVGCSVDTMRTEQFPVFSVLLNAVHRGVKVRLLTNNYTTPTCADQIAPLDFLFLNNIDVRFYTTTTFMHSKYTCVDNKTASISSVNFSATSFLKNREAGVVVSGNDDVVQFTQSVFEYDFDNAERYTLTHSYTQSQLKTIQSTSRYSVYSPPPFSHDGAYITPKPKATTGNYDVTVFTSPDNAYSTVMADAQSAKTSFAIMIYQINDDDLCQELITMHQNGVNVTLLVSYKIYDYDDWKTTQVCYNKLYNAGLAIRRCPSYYTYSHQKFWIVDNEHVGMSTGNWSPTDYPDASTFPPYGSSNWVKANRDFTLIMHGSDVVNVFMNVLSNDFARGSDWHPSSALSFAAPAEL